MLLYALIAEAYSDLSVLGLFFFSEALRKKQTALIERSECSSVLHRVANIYKICIKQKVNYILVSMNQG
ncbi:hypothetical protein CPS_0878 [Colwellia psychrerythraea 34H]|uniref:Uncharacterized protein n=1 Tax=Colwellia psychrerythraea (strain 34H / ATCC BAA-681) TaxID=167879 RepID=Q487Y8_COLP3|nr:hypothetical protein CPS_0878 [Colwellia psychrerythraea 34H]